LLPLTGGKMGAYNREKLVVFEPESSAGDAWHPGSSYDWGELETLVASPAGTYLAWLWSSWDGERDLNHVRVARLGRELEAEATLDFCLSGWQSPNPQKRGLTRYSKFDILFLDRKLAIHHRFSFNPIAANIFYIYFSSYYLLFLDGLGRLD
jgi:hypothetical protein